MDLIIQDSLPKHISHRFKHSFLESFHKYHNDMIPIYGCYKKHVLYGQIFNLRVGYINRYSRQNSIRNNLLSFLLGILKLKVFTIGNPFVTNINFSDLKGIKNPVDFLKGIINNIHSIFGVNNFIFPDSFFHEIDIKDPVQVHPNLIKIEVEEDMFLPIRDSWKNYSDYYLALKKKYKKRQRDVLRKSAKLKVKELSALELDDYSQEIQELFDKIKNKASFNPVHFQTKTFKELILSDIQFKVFGYFLNNNLIAFSSAFIDDKILCSYFVGFESKSNKSYHIYERILLDTIGYAISNKCSRIIFGRTASEFKSNVGAIPKKSYIYVYLKNPFLRFFIKPLIKRLKPKKWIQRRPFKYYKT